MICLSKRCRRTTLPLMKPLLSLSLVLGVFLAAVMPALAAGPIKMASTPSLSNDGQTLYFAWRGDIWSAPTTGGQARQLTQDDASDSAPHLSPDGKQLAFISNRDGSNQVYLMPPAGGAVRQVTFHTEGYQIQAWLPDGSGLITSGNRDHFWRYSERMLQISVSQRQAEQVLFDAYSKDASLSPDGKQLLFVREGERWWRKGYRGSRSAQIWQYDLTTGKFTQILNKETECRSPIWLPDASGFYYVGAESGSLNLMKFDFKSGESTQLTSFDDDSVLNPSLSRDGSTLVFRHLFDLYRINTAEKTPRARRIDLHENADTTDERPARRLLSQAREVAFTDDGLEIAFIAGGDLWVMDTVLREPMQVTKTASFESDPVFARDGKSLYFIATNDGQPDIWQATPAEPDKYWWQNDEFELKQLTSDATTESDLKLSPDGKYLAYTRERGDVWIRNTESGKTRKLFESFLGADFDFSPDSRWIAYAVPDQNFNSDVWIAPLDGSSPAVNVSRHPDNESQPRWSADGSLLAFTGRRTDTEVDIYYLWLQSEREDETSRARKLKKALEAIAKARKKPSTSGKPATPDPANANSAAKPAADPKTSAKPAAAKPPAGSVKPIQIDFENIHRRLHRISIANSSESNLLWSHTGRKLAFSATISGKRGTYTVDIPDSMTPKLLSTTTGSHARWLKSNKIAWLASGTPATLSATGSATSYSFRARQEYLESERRQAAFDACWRVMRDWWYDDRFDNRNWDAVRRKYREMAKQSGDMQTLVDIVHLMLGELNGSHLGFRVSSRSSSTAWTTSTAHLGLRFDSQFKGPGLKIRDVIPGGPTDKATARVAAGEFVMQIDGQAVDPQLDLTTVLNGVSERDIVLHIKSADGKQERDVTVRPMSYSAARSLLYKKWMDDNRAMVDKLSGQRAGYLHITAMNWPSFLEFERELYDVGYGKDGLVIDVRENGGGFTTDHLLTALTQPVHAITVPRGGQPGYPHDRMVYATWNKPIVVLCNQNSFSNAEIFSHAIKGLKRGKVVGVPTAGGVISTGSAGIMDVGILRRPFRGWFVAGSGQDMELNGAVPHIIVWPQPGEIPTGKDRQIEAAVKALLKDIRKRDKKTPPDLIKASERRAEGK